MTKYKYQINRNNKIQNNFLIILISLTQVSHVNSLVLQGGDIEANTDCYVVHDVTYCE